MRFFLFTLLFHLSSSLFCQTFVPGEIVDSVYCDDDFHSYALYVPEAYDESKTWPILYFLDPSARGKYPVEGYQFLAEKHGIILAGSNNSKNGPLANSEAAFRAIWEHSRMLLNIDDNVILASGFSGGGRFSQYLATQYADIDGILPVAGPKNYYYDKNEYLNPEIKYVGIVGTRDMNYREHIRWEQRMARQNRQSGLIVYEAGHQWPPKKEYEFALDHLLGLVQFDFVDGHSEKMASRIDSLVSNNSPHAERLIQSLQRTTRDELFSEGQFNKWLSELNESTLYDKAVKQEEKDLFYEGAEQSKLLKAAHDSQMAILLRGALDSANNLEWWRSELKIMKSKARKVGREADLNSRLLDHMRGVLYGMTEKAKQLDNTDLALFSNNLNLIISENAIWYLWERALILAKDERKKKSLRYLKMAQKKDVERLNRIRTHSYWDSFRDKYTYLFE